MSSPFPLCSLFDPLRRGGAGSFLSGHRFEAHKGLFDGVTQQFIPHRHGEKLVDGTLVDGAGHHRYVRKARQSDTDGVGIKVLDY